MLEIYAGPTALATIKQQGLTPNLFTSMLGASGGPKWFTLLGLDRYLFGEFFKARQSPLHICGSSAGAFRSACFAQKDPVAAIERLAKNYSETVYSDKPTTREISESARTLLDSVLGDSGVKEIIENPIIKAHFFVAKSNGFCASEIKAIQGLGLIKSIANNRIDRARLGRQYERFVFQPRHSELTFNDPDHIPTHRVSFTPENLKEALLASGSIPMVMRGIKNIPNCPAGMYRDGGIIDYHFDLDITTPGLTLYPHFSSTLKAGWFDKNSSRSVRMQNYDKTVLLCPSAAFIDSLPYHKIPDRNDFKTLSPQKRLAYWQTVFSQSEQLAEQFSTLYQHQHIDQIQDISRLLA